MRKFIVTLVLLLILIATGLFFGWVQMAVPPGSWGVMRSKTHGYDKELIRPGEFRWVWYKLIPYNTEILCFSPERVNLTLDSRGELPSGKSYAAFAGIDGDFSWEMTAEFSFTINPASLPVLVEQHSVTSQEDLRLYAEELGARIQDFTLGRLRLFTEDEVTAAEFAQSASASPGMPPALETEVYQEFPTVENFSYRIRSLRFPDFALYRLVRGLYEEYLQKQRELLAVGLAQSAELKMGARFRFDELERYGELLTKYPVLLRYLAMESGYAGVNLSAGD